MNTTIEKTYKNEAVIEQRKKLVIAIADESDRASEIARKICEKIGGYPYECIVEGYIYDVIWAKNLKTAVETARDDIDRNTGYEADECTLWLKYDVRAVVPDGYNGFESDSFEIVLDHEEPECIDGHEHDWRNPHSVVGGIEENPGVWGHGGGAIIKQVCAHCGNYMITDTWAQNPSTGEQGLTSVSYEDADDDSLAWVRRRLLATLRPTIEGVLNDCDEVTEFEIIKDSDTLYRIAGFRGDPDDADYIYPVKEYLAERMPAGVALQVYGDYGTDESGKHRRIDRGLIIELDV